MVDWLRVVAGCQNLFLSYGLYNVNESFQKSHAIPTYKRHEVQGVQFINENADRTSVFQYIQGIFRIIGDIEFIRNKAIVVLGISDLNSSHEGFDIQKRDFNLFNPIFVCAIHGNPQLCNRLFWFNMYPSQK